MLVEDAQREMRTVYQGGYIGQAVSGVLWLISAALGTWVSVGWGMVSLFFFGMLIYPLVQLTLKLTGRPASLQSGNPLQQLAKQVAFIVPLCLPVIYGAMLYKTNWYYPAFMIVVGAHYLPFMFMYGIWQYLILAVGLIVGGILIGMYFSGSFTIGAWLTGLLLVGFAVFLWLRFSDRRAETA